MPARKHFFKLPTKAVDNFVGNLFGTPLSNQRIKNFYPSLYF